MNNLPNKLQKFTALSSAKLAKAIYQADVPEEVVRKLPAQTLFLVVKHNGLDSSADLIEMSTFQQCRLLLDFDCWQKDDFQEDNFWAWLAITDANSDLKLLNKIIKTCDLSLISLLVAKYVKWVILEEPTDEPPAAEYYTPDKGTTWLNIQAPDANKTFLLGRLLALIFETDAELFYELLSTTGMSTNTEIIEEAYQNKLMRLRAEGMPDDEQAYDLNTPLQVADVKKVLENTTEKAIISDVIPITPLLYDSLTSHPLKELLAQIKDQEEAEAELTLIMNCALVYFKVDLWNTEEVQFLTEKVKGAINIGLEIASSLAPTLSYLDIFAELNFQTLYRLGLGQLFSLKKAASKLNNEQLQQITKEAATFSLVAGLREAFPTFPRCINQDEQLVTNETGQLESGYQAFEHINQITFSREIIDKLLT